jgi:hypothetical protein
VGEASQTADVLAIVNVHVADKDGTIGFVTGGETLWVKTDS